MAAVEGVLKRLHDVCARSAPARACTRHHPRRARLARPQEIGSLVFRSFAEAQRDELAKFTPHSQGGSLQGWGDSEL